MERMDSTSQENPIGSPPEAKNAKLNGGEDEEEEDEQQQPRKITTLDYDCFEWMAWVERFDRLAILVGVQKRSIILNQIKLIKSYCQ